MYYGIILESSEENQMRVLVLNGSPSGKNSITLQTVFFIEKFFENTEFEILHAAQKIKSYEKDFSQTGEALRRADLIVFCYPVYTFLVPAQLHRFIELIKENEIDLAGKYATQLTTSKHFYDTTAHQFIRDNCDDLGLRYIKGLSADMEDLLGKKGRKEALDFFRYVRWNMKNGFFEPAGSVPSGCAAGESISTENAGGETVPADYVPFEKQSRNDSNPDLQKGKPVKTGVRPDGKKIAVVADLPEGSSRLRDMVDAYMSGTCIPCELINIREFPFAGGCLGCFHCASDGTCIYKDGFDTFLRERIQDADAIIYAYSIKDHSMGSRFKMFDDRQFCNGHRTVTMGKPVGYLVEGDLGREMNLQVLMEARAQVGGNFLAGTAVSGADAGEQIVRLCASMEYAIAANYNPPKNFYGVGGLKIFRDLIYQMQGLMREDHRFYKKHGFYDFPQKKKGMIAGMYLVGAMMSNQKISGKLGGKMTEGMLLPYKKVLEKADRGAR